MARQSIRRRPFGVTVICLLQIASIMPLVEDIYRVQLGQPSRFLQGITEKQLLLALLLATALAYVVIAVGLWYLQRWAWFLVMIRLGFGMAADLWRYANDNPLYISMLLSVLMVFYLNQREVQRAFERKREVRGAT